MLQEKLYPNWARAARKWWNQGYHRIILFWMVVVVTSAVVLMVIITDWITWDRLNFDFIPTNEVSRGFLASFILVMDLLIVMQVDITLRGVLYPALSAIPYICPCRSTVPMCKPVQQQTYM